MTLFDSKDFDAQRFNDAVAVYFAMVKAGFKRKTLSPAEFARRFALERILQARRLCDGLALWRACRRKDCRRHRRCCGDQHKCLNRALALPRETQIRVREKILEATPRNIGRPEREARLRMPRDLYE
jgi:hypothetical protein